MKSHIIEPFYFPTTVCFIDDSKSFLSNLNLQLDSHLAFRLYDSPQPALASINTARRATQASGSFFSPYRDPHHESDAQQVIAMSLDAIRRQVHDPHRFELTSVVVVDYDMPGLNGLEFCRRIDDPAVRKILLTGKADEHVAVKSFNEGLIDRFIRKQDAEAIPALNRAIADLQKAYFTRAYGSVLDALALSDFRFQMDPVFATNVTGIFHALGIVEHYPSYQPNGLLMLDATGTPYRLIVHTEQTLRGVKEVAIAQGAPAGFLAELDSHRSLPYFWNTDGYYPSHCREWQPYMHPASVCLGERLYVYSVVRQPPGFTADNIVSYDSYLSRLDTELQAAWGPPA